MLQSSTSLSSIPTTKPYPTLHEINQEGCCAVSQRDILQFNVNNIANLAEAALEILLTSIFWQATDVDLIWLQSTESEHQSRTHKRANMEQKRQGM
jgi:hypothetical protein